MEYARRRERKARRSLARIALALGLLAAGAGSGYFLASRAQPRSAPSAPEPPPPGRQASAVDPGTRTTPYTVFTFRTRYPACGGEVNRTEAPGAAGAGLSRAEVERRYPGWTVEFFRPAQVVLVREQPGPCPEEAVYRTVTVRDGRVVVHAGRPGRLGPLLQDTGIDVDRLLPQDREKLARGVEVRGGRGRLAPAGGAGPPVAPPAGGRKPARRARK